MAPFSLGSAEDGALQRLIAESSRHLAMRKFLPACVESFSQQATPHSIPQSVELGGVLVL
jgi:hypothetical protein